jgi:hypothetical protein
MMGLFNGAIVGQSASGEVRERGEMSPQGGRAVGGSVTNIIRLLLVLFGLWAAGPCRAEGPVWAKWEETQVGRQGPKEADGVLFYFHGRDIGESAELPIPLIFTEMAKVAKWDILRINRRARFDAGLTDDQILQFTAEQVSLARRQGYRRVYIAGYSRGAWLALSAADLSDVDAILGLAPSTVGLEVHELEWQRDELARRLSSASVKRIAAFFFRGDPRENTEVSRADAIRRAMQGSGAAVLLVDRPPDLLGHGAGVLGRFVRRYRDCLVQFMEGATLGPREVECAYLRGYAVGSDIGFPAAGLSSPPPPDAREAVVPYIGRWQGDDERGSYVIMESADVGPTRIIFRLGFSPPSWISPSKPWIREIPFEIDQANGRLLYQHPTGGFSFVVRAISATELNLEMSAGPAGLTENFRLLKQSEKTAD